MRCETMEWMRDRRLGLTDSSLLSAVGRNAPRKGRRAAVTFFLPVLYGVHDDCRCQDKVLPIFEGIVTCAGNTGDVSGRFIHALDWSDGGS